MTLSAEMILGLQKNGYSVLPNALSTDLCEGVREEIRQQQTSGNFRAAGIGKAEFHRDLPEIRRDGTYWFKPDQLSSVQKQIWHWLEGIRQVANQELWLGLWELEGHYAIYPPGAFYRRHFDRFQNDSRRTLSVVLFFNECWEASDGGILRLTTPEGDLDILPESGTAVIFLSEQIQHEVTETSRERLSFAGWFKQR